jgi:3-isopropylmalate/(R)-2-methylmalate dehydratase large subunit
MGKSIHFTGRILYLSQDPACIEAQLAGADVSLAEAMPLRDSVSTDEITPVTVMFTYDERLGRYPYVGFKAGERLPVGPDAIRNGGFCVTVAGKRYGKGSSRESSPLAERAAGIRLIVAESFERIYQQNCDNLGLYTSTDFGLLERIRAGEAIDLEEFLQGRDELTRKIVASGGLMAYSRAANWPDPAAAAAAAAPEQRPRTLVEKIIERHLHPGTPMAPGAGVFVAADWRFSHDYFTGMSAYMMRQAFGPEAELYRPERIVAFQDHLILAPQSVPHVRDGLLPGVANLAQGHRDFVQEHPVRVHGALPDGSGSDGICHAIMAEQYALPGQVVVGTDSHTPHSGALGCLAFGAGATEVANSWVTGYVRCTVAPTLRVEIDGPLRPGVTAKDIVLHLLRQDAIRKGEAIGAVFEYTGSTVRALPVDERATLTNMVAELGGFTGIVAPDERTAAFLKERRGVDFTIEPWMASDRGAQYKAVIRLDAAAIGPMLARPGDPGNGMDADELAEPVPIDIAYGGSCTAGKREDFDYYNEVLQWGLDHGLRVAANTRLYLQFGTLDVRQYCADRGYLDTFEKAGITLVMPGCGACANCGPGQSTSASEVTISAINRNFPGRSGPGQVWLASPYTVAASALAGRITSFARLQEAHR